MLKSLTFDECESPALAVPACDSLARWRTRVVEFHNASRRQLSVYGRFVLVRQRQIDPVLARVLFSNLKDGAKERGRGCDFVLFLGAVGALPF